MRANFVLLLAVLFALVFYTSSIRKVENAGAQRSTTSRQTTQSRPTSPNTRKNSTQTTNTRPSKTNSRPTSPNAKPTNNRPTSPKLANKSAKPAAQKKTRTQTGSPAKPAPVKLCSFNKIGSVPGSPIHKFSVLNVQSTKYENKDFDVTWREQKIKRHGFFNWAQRQAAFSRNFPKMKCQVADKAAFGKVCNYQPAQLDQFYANAFGKDIVFKCKVPENNFVLSTRFVLQLSDFATSAGGRWSVFLGLYSYKSEAAARKTIQQTAKQVKSQIKSTRLTTFDINSNLNIIPDFVKGSLSWVFNSNINSNYVKTIQQKRQYDIADTGYLKILPPGTEFIIGSIYNGTTSVKQICDNYKFDDAKDNCNIRI